MLKKLSYLFIILIIATLFLNTTYAIDVVMNSNNIPNTQTQQTIDNTIYSSNTGTEDSVSDPYEQVATTTTTDYDESTELSISDIINIVLISVGIVLVLLGIAIILKLK